jgi:chaperone required for assembly of F1-ATPase
MTEQPEEQRIKRFYETADVKEEDGAFQITLDGRTARTPGRQVLATPHRALAEAMAAEWQAQGEFLDMPSMMLSRQRMVVIDRAEADREKWQHVFTSFLGSDLLCYLADGPAELVERQKATLQPYLDWCADTHGIRLETTSGIMAVEQPAESIAAAREYVDTLEADRLFCLVSATETVKSAVLALALVERFKPHEEIFDAGWVDESFQAEKWGIDAEAAEREQNLRAEFAAVDRYLELVS